jgi:hypothetical protein
VSGAALLEATEGTELSQGYFGCGAPNTRRDPRSIIASAAA